MLERDEIVAECFNNILIIKGQPFARYLELDNYGYINGGMSVSHMAYELAENLGHKNIILIGQDLAYAKDGQTHSQGFIHANLHNGDYERDLDKFSTTAYGGNGKFKVLKFGHFLDNLKISLLLAKVKLIIALKEVLG